MTNQQSNEITASIYTFKFVIRADKWEDVVRILKDELNITKRHDTSDRQIDGLYLVACVMNGSDLTKDFYEKVSNSENIAIHTDGKSSSLYPKILEETRVVEERLRWLLLHVSDAIEDYAKILGYEKSGVIDKGNLDPITSKLSFESMLDLFDIDQSWSRDGVDETRMRTLIEGSLDFNSFKSQYLDKTTPKTIWKSISELVLQQPVEWSAVEPKLKTIKKLRNKCAHFHTVTDDDLSQAKHLSSQLVQVLNKKKTVGANDLRAYAGLNKQITETMRSISSSYMESIKALTDTVLASQGTFQHISSLHSPALESIIKSQDITRQLVNSTTFKSSFMSAQQAALDAVQAILKSKSFYLDPSVIESMTKTHSPIINSALATKTKLEDDLSADNNSVDPIHPEDDKMPPGSDQDSEDGKNE